MVDSKSSTDRLEEVTIFGVSRGVPSDPLEEVMSVIFIMHRSLLGYWR